MKRGAFRPILAMTLAFFFWLAAPPCSAQEASGTVVFVYEAGAATNSLRLIPLPGQRYETLNLDGATCVRQLTSAPDANRTWHFDVPDDRWLRKVGDGLMTVEYLATEGRKLSVMYDACFHAYYGFLGPLFELDRFWEAHFMSTFRKQEEFPGNRYRNEYRINKAWLGNRQAGKTDINFHEGEPSGVMIRRVTLTLKPLSEKSPNPPVSFDRFIAYFFRLFWNRSPTAQEKRILASSFQEGHLRILDFVTNLIKNWEYLDRNFFPLEKNEALKRLFHLAIDRDPTIAEMNTDNFRTFRLDNQWGVKSLVIRYYPEIIETALKKIGEQK